MKTLIVALNSKYIHSSLAPWYLKAACDGARGEIKVAEFTINENIEAVLSAIYFEKPDVAAFSCYIWNIGHVLRLAENLKKILPEVIILCGGPEVSYDPAELLAAYNSVDYVISGEGETVFCRLLESIDSKTPDKLPKMRGVSYRDGSGAVKSSLPAEPPDLGGLPSPYTPEMLAAVKGKIAYFESSRGCPFSCAYCLSSVTGGVRYFPIERVKNDLVRLANAGVRQVKFVDRTFNCHPGRAKEIFRFIIDSYGKQEQWRDINFHFEAAADIFDAEMLEILSKAPSGLIQLEIGIQSANGRTLEAVGRKTDMEKAFGNIRALLRPGNIHIHLDLIAGLPYEDLDSFKTSFNKVLGLKPHNLQLGFLKLLKGSPLRRDAGLHGYNFRSYAPYELLSGNYMSFEDLALLKGIEELVDRYWNTGRFAETMEVITSCFSSPFDFFAGFLEFIRSRGYAVQAAGGKELYTLLLDYGETIEGLDKTLLKESLKLDFLASDSSRHLPDGLERVTVEGFQDMCFALLKDEKLLARFLPAYAGMPAKQIFKKVHFEHIKIGKEQKLFLFDYSLKNPVTGRYIYYQLDSF